ncbi:glycosyltransferase family 2 protein [Mucilaginibacter calamicampi]|uniref:Glycosyltransferase family 2 protein n=1 Tax=Mucilaginibacter calamicampi TaxID=1302352 RepID=A0ABW2YUN4_9SPHI
MKLVSIITVNFNQSYVTEQLLTSISQTNTYSAIEIIVVDNGSTENSVPEWKIKYPEIIFIRSDKNLGFAGGNNLGINAAKGDYFFLVNNDTEFTDGLVQTLVETLESNSRIGMVSPKIRYFDQPEMLQYMGFTDMNYYTARNASIGQFETDDGQYDHLTGRTGYAHGAAMMVKNECIDKAGLMADTFFLYYEELDWCDRIKRAGYEIWLQSAALIYHKESVSVGKISALKEYFMNRNRILFIRRNAPLPARLFFYIYFVALVAPRNILKYIKIGHKDFIRWLLKAIWWNVTQSKDSKKLGYPIAL